MEIRHVRLDFDEGIASKRDLLNLEIDLIYSLRRIHTYRLLRKEEMILSTKLKHLIEELKEKLNNIKSNFPQDFIKLSLKKKQKIPQKKDKVKDEELKIEDELAEIREKLAKLNQYI
jgi:hypothetical protein